ncbi:MAG: MarR family transcriptional regulator [Candidatus Marinimicrobia bacterium]|nr:MarR family transcriptional regulator [Candidatus Neomarinimicrobiota bacterium]
MAPRRKTDSQPAAVPGPPPGTDGGEARPAAAPPPDPDQLVARLIEAAGHFTQSLGQGRALGLVYARCYFCPNPLSLNELATSLAISKGSASMTIRQLEQWGALARTTRPDDRKDYFHATEHFGRILRRAILDVGGRKYADADALLAEIGAVLSHPQPARNNPELAFLHKRFKRVQQFRQRIQRIWDNTLLAFLLQNV